MLLGIALLVAWEPQELSAAEARKVLDGYSKQLRNAKTIKITQEIGSTYKLEHWLMKPNHFRSQAQSIDGGLKIRSWFYTRGKIAYLINPDLKQYDILEWTGKSDDLIGFEPFYSTKRSVHRVWSTHRLERPLYEVEITSSVHVYLDPKTLLPVGREKTYERYMRTYEPLRVEVGFPMQARDFAWKPGRDYMLRMDMRRG